MSTITKVSKKNKAIDVALIETIKNGSKRESNKAFEALYLKYYSPVLFNLSRKMNSTDAEDVTAELFSKLHKKIEMYDEKSAAFNTWLFTLTRNAFIDFLRKRKLNTVDLENQTDDEGHPRIIEFIDENILTPDQVIIRKEKSDLLKSIIENTLKKPELKNLIIMRYFDELSYDEMAKELGVPLGTVKAQLHRAKKALELPCEKYGLKLK